MALNKGYAILAFKRQTRTWPRNWVFTAVWTGWSIINTRLVEMALKLPSEPFTTSGQERRYVQVWVNPSKQLRNPVHCMHKVQWRKVFSSFFFFYCAASVLQKCIYIILYLFYEQLFGISVYACNLHKINTLFGPEKCAVFFRNFFDLFILFFFFLFNHSATQKVFHFFLRRW